MIRVRVDDLAFVAGEAIAWPVNAMLEPLTPLLRRLEQAGGRRLLEQRRVQQPLAVGSAVVTGAGELGVGLLVSAVVASDDEPVSRDSVRRALSSALQRAVDWEIGELICAPFGLGAGNLDIEESAEIMMSLIPRHMAQARFPAEVTVVVENALEEELFTSSLGLARP